MKKGFLVGVLSTSLLLAASQVALAEEPTPWGFSWNYDNGTTEVSSVTAEGDAVSVYMENSPNTATITHDTGKAFLVTASKYGNGNSDSFDGQKRGACYGIKYMASGHQILDDSVVVSTDFMLGREGAGCYLMSPEVSGNVWFPCTLYVDKTGHMSMVNGCRWGGDNYSVDIGEIENYKWYNVAIKYTHKSSYGLTADVYLNGEKKVSGFCGRYVTAPLQGNFSNAVICDNIAGYRPNLRSAAADEGVFFDNTYIGNDFSILDYKTQISDVTQDLNELGKVNVHFNNIVQNNLSATDFFVYDSTFNKYADASSIEWTDNQTATLTLDKALTPNSSFTLVVISEDGTIDVSSNFKTKLEYLYGFDNEDMTNIARYGRTLNVSGNEFATDSFSDFGKGLAVYKIGDLKPEDSHIIGRDTGYGVEAISGYTAGYTGSIKIACDFMLESENVNGGIVFNSTSFDNVSAGIYMTSTFDDENQYQNTKLLINNTELCEITPRKWYRLYIDCTRLSSGTLVIESVSLDETVVSTTAVIAATDISKISFLASPIVFEAKRTTDERMFIDNLYIGPKNDYNVSKSSIGTTAKANGADISVYAGSNKNVATFIAALYDSTGKLKESTFKKISALPYTNVSDSLTFESTVEATDIIKIFKLDDLNNIKPYISPNASYTAAE